MSPTSQTGWAPTPHDGLLFQHVGDLHYQSLKFWSLGRVSPPAIHHQLIPSHLQQLFNYPYHSVRHRIQHRWFDNTFVWSNAEDVPFDMKWQGDHKASPRIFQDRDNHLETLHYTTLPVYQLYSPKSMYIPRVAISHSKIPKDHLWKGVSIRPIRQVIETLLSLHITGFCIQLVYQCLWCSPFDRQDVLPW